MVFQKQMLPAFMEREQIRTTLELCVRTYFPHPTTYMFGSSSMMLFEENSDIDVCFRPPPGVVDPLKEIYETVEALFPGTEYLRTPKIPFLRYNLRTVALPITHPVTSLSPLPSPPPLSHPNHHLSVP